MNERIEKDEEREQRIENEALVDAHGEEERAMSWYYYLEERISFPFTGKCIVGKRTSPLKIGETVKVSGLPPIEDYENTMVVEIEWNGAALDVPLEQIDPLRVDEDTREAIEDWHYWIARGYQF